MKNRNEKQQDLDKLKTELARILSEQGYIDGYDVLPATFAARRFSSA